jgi:predicted dehydrogenase
VIRAAIVGLGGWGRHIVRSLAGSKTIELVRAADVNVEAVADFASDHGLDLYDGLEPLLADGAIDAVILATPHSLHEAQILAVAGAGKHVFCEKPLALSKASAERSIAACRAAGVVLGIGHERRFEPGLIEIKRMVAEGTLGTIMHVESNFSHDKLAKVAATDWRASPIEAPAAAMTGMGIHLTDAYIHLFGEVAEVYAQTARRVTASQSGDVVSVQLRFAAGMTGYLNAIMATPLYLRFQVFGSEAWVEARNATHPDTPGATTLTVCPKGGEPQSRELAWTDSVRANFEAFAEAVAGRADYPFTCHEMLHNSAVFEAICRSAESGAPVAPP